MKRTWKHHPVVYFLFLPTSSSRLLDWMDSVNSQLNFSMSLRKCFHSLNAIGFSVKLIHVCIGFCLAKYVQGIDIALLSHIQAVSLEMNILDWFGLLGDDDDIVLLEL